MKTVNDEIVSFLKSAPVSDEDREKLTARARVKVDKKLIGDIRAAMDAAYQKVAAENPAAAEEIRKIDTEYEAKVTAAMEEYEVEVAAAEKDAGAVYRQAADDINRINLQQVKEEMAA